MKRPVNSKTLMNLERLESILNDKSFFNQKDNENYARIKNDFLRKINNYINFLEELDKKFQTRQDFTSEIAFRFFNNHTDAVLCAAHKLEQLVDVKNRKEIKYLFRECVLPWVKKSEVVTRALEKPRGYGGDYLTIEMFYNQESRAKGIGYYCDQYMLKNKLAHADISRKDKMVELLIKYINKIESPRPAILNLGCGGCRDLRDLFNKIPRDKNLDIIAVDQDKKALSFAQKELREINDATIIYMQRNIVDLLAQDRKREECFLRKFDIVYSIGLVDYFPDNVLRLFVKFCVRFLAPKGKLIIAHKNCRKWKSFLASDWFCDWRFFQRDRDKVLGLINDEIKDCKLEIEWEKTRHMFFLIISGQ